MVSYQYSYLIGDFILLAIWIILYLWRKDIRKEMLLLSIIFGIGGIFVQFIYIQDWWHPLTITNTIVGIEDFLFGFVTGGIAGVIYEEIFKRKVKIRKTDKKKENYIWIKLFLIISLLTILLFIGFYILKISSFYSSVLAFTISIFIIWIKRKDLIIDSIISGILLMIISFIVFNLMEIASPGWIHSTWYFENLSGIIILNSPLEDVIFFFLSGAFIGPLYEYWQEGRLINIKS